MNTFLLFAVKVTLLPNKNGMCAQAVKAGIAH